MIEMAGNSWAGYGTHDKKDCALKPAQASSVQGVCVHLLFRGVSCCTYCASVRRRAPACMHVARARSQGSGTGVGQDGLHLAATTMAVTFNSRRVHAPPAACTVGTAARCPCIVRDNNAPFAGWMTHERRLAAAQPLGQARSCGAADPWVRHHGSALGWLLCTFDEAVEQRPAGTCVWMDSKCHSSVASGSTLQPQQSSQIDKLTLAMSVVHLELGAGSTGRICRRA